MRRRYQQTGLQRIDDILQRTLKKNHIPLKIEDRRLRDLWHKAVGPNIAVQTLPDTIRGAVLFVKVANSAWVQQLHFLKQEIMLKFNNLHKENPIKDIYFAIGKVAAPAAAASAPPAPIDETGALKVRDKKMIEHSLAGIADDELRAILKRAMIKEMTQRRLREKQRARKKSV
jgi:hypothetical protein